MGITKVSEFAVAGLRFDLQVLLDHRIGVVDLRVDSFGGVVGVGWMYSLYGVRWYCEADDSCSADLTTSTILR